MKRSYWYVFDVHTGRAIYRSRRQFIAAAIARLCSAFPGAGWYDYGRPGREIVNARHA